MSKPKGCGFYVAAAVLIAFAILLFSNPKTDSTNAILAADRACRAQSGAACE